MYTLKDILKFKKLRGITEREARKRLRQFKVQSKHRYFWVFDDIEEVIDLLKKGRD